ncbi:MAG: hypothetical protein KGL12_06470 [Rhodospirillales bacterium]|nr:hypothetical protein [Rhodospirillales bacterium]
MQDIALLLQDCLELWECGGQVQADGDGLALTTEAGRFTLHPAPAPLRWRIGTPARRAAGRGPRAAASIGAALLVLRAAMEDRR